MQGCSRLGKFYLSRWKFYEENIGEFHEVSHIYKNAITFFKCLKQLERDELELLAKRWYNTTAGNKRSYDFDTYETFKPVPYDVIAYEYNQTTKDIQLELRALEKKLGAFLFKEQHGREWHEEPPKTEWCTNCEGFKGVARDNKCIKCDKEFFDYKLYRSLLDAPS